MQRTILALSAAGALLFAQPAAADTVCDWWEFAGKIAGPPGSQPTPDGQRAVSRASLAMFEAVNAIDRRYRSYLEFPAGDPKASQDAAAATAAYRVLLHHFPSQKTTLEESYLVAMAAVPETAAREAGRLVGEAAAQAAMSAGGIDPALTQSPYRPRTTPGVWIGASLPGIEPHQAAFRPWAIPSAAALRAPPPPALSSAEWARDYEEVRRTGGKASTERTAHQTLMARYRQSPDVLPAMRAAADAPGRTPVRNARMFALYQMATDDAITAMAESKLHHNFWRPITAIRNGGDDGNPATQPDPAWTPLLSTPNFPEHPCGHCTVAAAGAEVMKAETGPRPSGGVRVGSYTLPNALVQQLPSWDAWVADVSASRIYGGVHYRFANRAGEAIGREAARIVLERVARPLPASTAARKAAR